MLTHRTRKYSGLKFKENIFKRTFDVIFAIFGIIIISPVFILIVIVSLITEGLPIFYSSNRIGMNGAFFRMYKFRSMLINSDEIAFELMNGDLHSIGDEDPRITKWGRLLRKTRMDELPQFINVLRGEMSIVGPRPLPRYDIDFLIESSQEDYNKLMQIKPGLTSLGQLKVGYATTLEENNKRMKIDLLYHRDYSFFSDVVIIFSTIKLIFDGKGK